MQAHTVLRVLGASSRLAHPLSPRNQGARAKSERTSKDDALESAIKALVRRRRPPKKPTVFKGVVFGLWGGFEASPSLAVQCARIHLPLWYYEMGLWERDSVCVTFIVCACVYVRKLSQDLRLLSTKKRGRPQETFQWAHSADLQMSKMVRSRSF